MGEQAPVTVTVTVPPDAISGTVETAVVTAASPRATAVVTDRTTVGLTGTVRLGPDQALFAPPGSILLLTHTLTNGCNISQTLALSLAVRGGVTATVPPALPLGPFASATVTVEVEVTGDGVVTVTAAGQITGTARTVDRITARWQVFIPALPRQYPLLVEVEDAPDTCPGSLPIQVRDEFYRDDFDHPNDNDWYEFSAQAGVVYEISTFDLGPLGDTVLILYDYTCSDIQASNDDCVAGDPLSGSCLTWQAPADMTVHVLVLHYDWSQYGEGTGYTLYVR